MQEQNILIIKLGALGDVILRIGTIMSIHERFPNAKITVMTTKPFVSLFKSMSCVNEVIVDTRPRYNLLEWFKTCKKNIADKKWDYIFDLQVSNRTRKRYFNLVRFFSPFSVNWGFYHKKGFSFRFVEKNKRFSFGKITTSEMNFDFLPVDLSFLKGEGKNFNLLPDKPFLLIIPGCSVSHPYKRWPAEKYLDLVLTAEKKGIPSVVLGTDAESAEIEQICKNSKAVSFQNKASLFDIPELARRACAVVGNDTGPVHMSCYSKTPVIVLFCQKTASSANKLPNVLNLISENISDISVSDVWNAIQEQMKVSEK